jgi:hypothetical protein
LRGVRNAIETHMAMAQWLKAKRSSSHLKKRRVLPLVQPNGVRPSQMAELAEVDRQKIRVSS